MGKQKLEIEIEKQKLEKKKIRSWIMEIEIGKDLDVLDVDSNKGSLPSFTTIFISDHDYIVVILHFDYIKPLKLVCSLCLFYYFHLTSYLALLLSFLGFTIFHQLNMVGFVDKRLWDALQGLTSLTSLLLKYIYPV